MVQLHEQYNRQGFQVRRPGVKGSADIRPHVFFYLTLTHSLSFFPYHLLSVVSVCIRIYSKLVVYYVINCQPHCRRRIKVELLQVLAFPCNQFGDGNTYEPDSNAVVKNFVDTKISDFTPPGNTAIPFPLFAKSTVNAPMCTEVTGTGCQPDSIECCTANNGVYEFLRGARYSAGDPLEGGEIGWNFDKFLVGKSGQVCLCFFVISPPWVATTL